MLRRNGNVWEMYPHKVHYTQRGEKKSQWALPDKQWWSDFADKWDHTTIDKFEEIKVTDAMQTRFKEVKDMPNDFHSLYVDYVLSGDIPKDLELPTNHPFNVIRLRHADKKLDKDIEDAVMELTMAMSGSGGGMPGV